MEELADRLAQARGRARVLGALHERERLLGVARRAGHVGGGGGELLGLLDVLHDLAARPSDVGAHVLLEHVDVEDGDLLGGRHRAGSEGDRQGDRAESRESRNRGTHLGFLSGGWRSENGVTTTRRQRPVSGRV